MATAVALFFVPCVGLCPSAAGAHAKLVDMDSLAALESKADQAQPQERCFLYAQVVSQMTDLAGRQLNSGDSGQASATLMLVQRYAEKVQAEITQKTNKLKNAELLLERTSFRLKSILGSASYEDRQPVEATLKQLDQVQTALMLQVFKR